MRIRCSRHGNGGGASSAFAGNFQFIISCMGRSIEDHAGNRDRRARHSGPIGGRFRPALGRVEGTVLAVTLGVALAAAQVAPPGPPRGAPSEPRALEFESGGLKYQALTRGGVTVMFASLPTRVLGYAILQVAVSNGSVDGWDVRPENLHFERAVGGRIQALAARAVVVDVMDRAGRGDVGRLVSVYEAALFGNISMRSTNGYEARRRDAMAVGDRRMSAAAAAAAIVLGTTTLEPGQSTDGAVFFPNSGRPLGAGRLVLEAGGERFEFLVEAAP